MQRKLSIVYGNGIETSNDTHTWTKWADSKGNFIRLQISNKLDYVTLGYMAADADQRLDEMKIASALREAEQERIRLEEQQNNLDGL